MLRYAYISVLIFLVQLPCISQPLDTKDLIEIVEVDLPNGDVDLYALNKGYCPVTLKMDFQQIENFKAEAKLPHQQVIYEGDEKQFIMKLVRKNLRREAGYGYGLALQLGDVQSNNHEHDFVYKLPFENGSKYLVGQGFNGRFSHSGINAIDFNMDEGSKVCAARSGIVVITREDSGRGCKSSRCQNDANYVIIYHADGTFGHYGHLQKDGVLVEVGQEVKAGQVIGLSGNTGWSSGPHLHFEVFYPKENSNITIPVKFKVADGKIMYLKEGKFYTAWHPQ